MAIFCVTSNTKRTDLAKKSIRYIVHRRNQEQTTITRTLYDKYGITDKYAAYEAIDKAGERGKLTVFRTVISPDPRTEDVNRDLDLRLLTEATMQRLQLRLTDKFLQYFAAIHTDHSNNRHIHVILLLKTGRLSKADLGAFRTAAAGNAREQRRLLDRTQEATQAMEEGQPAATAQVIFRSQTTRQPVRQQVFEERPLDSAGGSPRHNPTCASCGWSQEMRRLTKTLYHCTSCVRIVEDQGIGMEVVREPSLELFQGLEVGAV